MILSIFLPNNSKQGCQNTATHPDRKPSADLCPVPPWATLAQDLTAPTETAAGTMKSPIKGSS